MSCFGGYEWLYEEIEIIRKKEPIRLSDCKDCGEQLIDEFPVNYCSYSPEVCATCGCRPCDQSC
jgi:hypothetical protein